MRLSGAAAARVGATVVRIEDVSRQRLLQALAGYVHKEQPFRDHAGEKFLRRAPRCPAATRCRGTELSFGGVGCLKLFVGRRLRAAQVWLALRRIGHDVERR